METLSSSLDNYELETSFMQQLLKKSVSEVWTLKIKCIKWKVYVKLLLVNYFAKNLSVSNQNWHNFEDNFAISSGL